MPLLSNHLVLSYLVTPFLQLYNIPRKAPPSFLAFVPFVHLLFPGSITKSKALV